MNENVRIIFERIKKTAEDAGLFAEEAFREAGKKTGETIEIAKLNMRIFDLSGEIGASYRKLGELLYEAHKGQNGNDDEINALLNGIDAKNAEIKNLRDRINLMRNITVCPVCACGCSMDDKFCKRCGAELT